jgi:recombination protein RecR
LGGVISPLDGIGPDQLNIEALVKRVSDEQTQEIIFALNPNIQGDTTVYYIGRKLKGINVKITTIARGISFGGELEYADEMTLAKSITNRIPVENYITTG